ncbi:hypothetical protein ACFOW4_08035 [Micromonospora sp. GCM10011542]|uniref:hypothetical protein n=1 Tax=Micromonospora sp. GCM10011542 TaxID=3317337 RepID=UPI00360D333F
MTVRPPVAGIADMVQPQSAIVASMVEDPATGDWASGDAADRALDSVDPWLSLLNFRVMLTAL